MAMLSKARTSKTVTKNIRFPIPCLRTDKFAFGNLKDAEFFSMGKKRPVGKSYVKKHTGHKL